MLALDGFSITYLSGLIAEDGLTSEELAQEVIRRCETFSHLNALISQNPDTLLEAARAADAAKARGETKGALHGIPLLIKDNIDTRDYPTTGGTPALEHDVPISNAPAVDRLLDAGAVIAGKANLHELAVGASSINLHFGRVGNPYRVGAIPGGSSGGNGAAVAARLVPAALGTDTFGSVRVPSSMCGICGFRPTHGRYPYGGVFPPTRSRDTVGPMATTIEDIVILDEVLSGDRLDVTQADFGGVPIGRPREVFCAVQDERTERVIEDAFQLLKDLGAEIVEKEIPRLAELTAKTAMQIGGYETNEDFSKYMAARSGSVTIDEMIDKIASPTVKMRMKGLMSAERRDKAEYLKALNEHRPALRQVVQSYFEDHNLSAIAFPTTPFPATDMDDDEGGVLINGEFHKAAMWYVLGPVTYQSVVGNPSLSVPAGLTKDGLPVGINFDGPRGSDGTLLALARAFETARGPLPLPPICA